MNFVLCFVWPEWTSNSRAVAHADNDRQQRRRLASALRILHLYYVFVSNKDKSESVSSRNGLSPDRLYAIFLCVVVVVIVIIECIQKKFVASLNTLSKKAHKLPYLHRKPTARLEQQPKNFILSQHKQTVIFSKQEKL